MKATIDKAGRVVIPKPLRDLVGFGPGEVEVTAEGAALRIEAITDDILEEEGDLLVIPATGDVLTVEDVRQLRDAGQR